MTLTADPLHTQIAALLPRLRRFARSITYQNEDADDLVADLEQALDAV